LTHLRDVLNVTVQRCVVHFFICAHLLRNFLPSSSVLLHNWLHKSITNCSKTSYCVTALVSCDNMIHAHCHANESNG
jgi:hypothetical protein